MINNYFSLGWVIFLIIIPFIVHFKETTLYGSWGDTNYVLINTIVSKLYLIDCFFGNRKFGGRV